MTPPLKAVLHLKTRLAPALAGVVFAFFLFELYRGWLVLFVALGGALLAGYAWMRSLAGGLSFTRRMRFGWAQVGDRMEEQFELHNTGWAPALWVEVEYHSTMPDYRPHRVSSVGGSGAVSRWQVGGMCTRRGVFTLGPVTLRASDPFGFFELRMEHPATNTVLVTPPIIPLPFIQIAPGGRAGEGRPRRFAPEETVSVSSLREYQPGDDLRLIHWPTTVRRQQFYVRLLDNSPASDWWIFLDLDARVQAGQGFDSTEEHGVILAASLADRGLRSGHPVGLVAHGAELAWLPPRHGEEQRHAILKELAVAVPGQRALVELLELARPLFRQNPSLIVITANPDPAWVDALLPLLRRGVVPTVLLLDAATYPSPPGQEVQNGNGQPRAATATVMGLLAELGVARHLLPRQFFDRPEARPGQQGQWRWRKTASSRAFLAAVPGDLAWKELS